MPNTISRVAPISPLLTNLAIGYQNGLMVAETILPVVPVATEKFTYYKFGRQHFRRYNTKRGLSSGFQRVDYSQSTATGSCEEYGLEHPIDDRIRDEAQAPLEPEVQGTFVITEGIKLDQEKRVASLVTASSNYHADLTSTPSVKWSTKTAGIHDDIGNAQEAIRKKIGLYPNTMLVSAAAAQKMSIANDITDYVKNTPGAYQMLSNSPDEGWMLPKVLWGMKLVIAGSVENTNNVQQSESISDIWSDYVVLAYVQPHPAKWRPSFGYIFRRSGASIAISRYREEKIKSDIIRGVTLQEELLLSTDDSSKQLAGYLFTDVLA